MDEQEPTISELFGRTWLLIMETLPAGIAVLAILTVVGTAIEFRTEGASLNIVFSITSIIAAYVLTVKALDVLGLLENAKPKRGIMATVGLGLLTGLGTLLGLLLIVPGIIFFVRWSIALPILLAEDVGIPEAMGRSWDDTKGIFWPILGFFIVIYVPLLLAVVVYTAISAAGHLTVPVAAVFNAFLASASICGWYGSVAVYASLRARPQLEQVFA